MAVDTDKLLDDLSKAITGTGGVMEQINALVIASEADRKGKIVPLIGSIINLIIMAIKAAV